MKKIVKYTLVLAASLFALASCKKEVEDVYTLAAADSEGCYGVYFPVQEVSGSHVFNPTQDPSIEVTVARTETKGEIRVPVVVTYSEDGIFEATDIVFADGQSETSFTLSFDNAKEGVQYKANIRVEDPAYASIYTSNRTAFDFSVLRVKMEYVLNPKTGEKAVIHWVQDWWGEEVDTYLKFYEVDGVRTCFTETIPDTHFYKDFYEGYGFFGTADAEGEGEWTFLWYVNETDDEGNQYIQIPSQYTGWTHSSYGADVWIYDNYGYYKDLNGNKVGFGSFLDEVKAGNLDAYAYYDGRGGFYLYTEWYYMSGIGGWHVADHDNVGIAEGFTRTDFSLKVETDYSYDGVTPVILEAGKDVSFVKYAVYPGELTSTQALNREPFITDGTDASAKFSDFELDEEKNKKYATLELAPETSGIYTVVVVSYDGAGAPQEAGYVIINHVAEGDVEEKSVVLSIFTEPTPERYASAGYNEYNSFAFGIAGKDLTDVHVAVTKLSSLTNKFVAALKADEKGTYAVDAAALSAINGTGGYYDAVGDLDPGTEYAVVAWATNGDMEGLAYSIFATTPSPEVWKPIGTGEYTEDFFTTFWGVENLTWEVEMAQSEDDPTRFKMIYPYDEKYGYNDPGDWDTSKSYDIVITIPDAEHVYIAPQEIGVNWGYGMISIASLAGYYMVEGGFSFDEVVEKGIPFGTCVDGVITFPEEKSLLVSLANYNNGDWYYANKNGAFKLVLPSGVTTAAAAPAASLARPAEMVGANELKAAPVVKCVFERDPKPISVKVTVSYNRRLTKKENRTMQPVADHRF